MSKFAEVLLPLPFDTCFTYKTDILLARGDIVEVNFGKRKLFGVVYKILSSKEATDFAKNSKFEIKDVIRKNDALVISESNLDFIDAVSYYNCAFKGLVLKAFIGFLNSDKVSEKTILGSKIQQEISIKSFKLNKLSEEQNEVSDGILSNILGEKDECARVSLIDGVTGSGKTEVYFKIIAEILAKNDDSQILIILPEIALSSQLLTRFEDVFAFKPILWHSKISMKEKRGAFYGIANGDVKVVIGARSSLLLPFKNLKLIIVDEEHDQSLKQNDVFNFNARDMAILRGSKDEFSVILSSATPSMESYSNALAKKYDSYKLLSKFGDKKNQIELVDLRKNKLDKGSYVSEALKKEMVKNLERKKQTLLFVNRRGYSPVMLCKSCGEKLSCTNCSANMVYHKSKGQFICHYCDNILKTSMDCLKCGSEGSMIDVGVGVEKLQEEVVALFPQAKIVLVTSDNVVNFDEMKEIVQRISANEVDIIIGTQMISKGYDFKDLTLIGVVDVDSILYSSDFRSLEKSFQLLSQLVGRSGRSKDEGRVMIQTYNSENFILQKVRDSDKAGFYEFEINNRKLMEMPPFSKMVKVEFSSFLEEDCKKAAFEVKKFLPINKNLEFYGPSPGVIPRIRNRYYYNIFIKVNKKINLQKLIFDIKNRVCFKKNIRFMVDIDPN